MNERPDPQAHALLVVQVPVLTVSEANVRESWQARSRRTRAQRTATLAALLAESDRTAGARLLARHGRLAVHLERRGARALDDDNLRGALKHVRDEVAAWCGCDDGPRGPLAFSYGQQSGRQWAKAPWVVVEVRRG